MLDTQAVAVVAHDAGGAVILASYIRRKNLNFLPVLAGPATSIFQDRFGLFVQFLFSKHFSLALGPSPAPVKPILSMRQFFKQEHVASSLLHILIIGLIILIDLSGMGYMLTLTRSG